MRDARILGVPDQVEVKRGVKPGAEQSQTSRMVSLLTFAGTLRVL
jgi:hypothetical protein